MPPMGKLPQTPRAKKVIEHSVQQARNLNHNYVGSEHILLGLLCEQEGVAWLVLTNFGLDLATVRAEINRLLGPTPRQSTGERQSTDESLGKKRAPAAPRTCPKCGHSPVVRVAPEATLDERIRGDVAAGTLILCGPLGPRSRSRGGFACTVNRNGLRSSDSRCATMNCRSPRRMRLPWRTS